MSLKTLPEWLKRPLPSKGELGLLKSGFRKSNLHTVCESARCPNIGECFSRKTATYMINGNICTRVCGFCDVGSGRPLPINEDEPRQLARSVAHLGMKYVVVTAVNRDDLPDGGASQFVKVANCLNELNDGIRYEFLIPDFMGKSDALLSVLNAGPTVLNHNLETVKRLTPDVRNKANYSRSLDLLKKAKAFKGPAIKTGVMLGLGENKDDLKELFHDVASIGVDILTLGQYLRPSEHHLSVQRFVPPEEFNELADEARATGIPTVFAGPFVRSSFHAGELAEQI